MFNAVPVLAGPGTATALIRDAPGIPYNPNPNPSLVGELVLPMISSFDSLPGPNIVSNLVSSMFYGATSFNADIGGWVDEASFCCVSEFVFRLRRRPTAEGRRPKADGTYRFPLFTLITLLYASGEAKQIQLFVHTIGAARVTRTIQRFGRGVV